MSRFVAALIALTIVCITPGCEQGSSRPVLFVFSAGWCGPCKRDKPTVEKVRRRYSVRVYDWDQNPNDFARYRVKGVPTYLVVQGGKVRVRTEHLSVAVETLKATK